MSGFGLARLVGHPLALAALAQEAQRIADEAGRVWDPKPEPFDGRVRVGEDPGDCQASDADWDRRNANNG